MNNFFRLLKGELIRLKKYNVITVNLLVSLVWFLVLIFIEDEALLATLLPLVLMLDATMMSVLFIGATMFFEKSEQTVATLLVTPTSYHAQILSKALANTIHMIFSSIVIALIFHFVRGVDVNFLYLTITLIVSIFFHSIFGFVFSYLSKEFTSMLMLVMGYSVIFMIPTFLFQFRVLFAAEVWEYLLLLSPNQATLYLVEASVTGILELQTGLALAALVALGVLLYIFVVYRGYKKYVLKQSGV